MAKKFLLKNFNDVWDKITRTADVILPFVLFVLQTVGLKTASAWYDTYFLPIAFETLGVVGIIANIWMVGVRLVRWHSAKIGKALNAI